MPLTICTLNCTLSLSVQPLRSYQQRELGVGFPLSDMGGNKRVPRLHEGREGARLAQQGRSCHREILLQVSNTGEHKLGAFACMSRYVCVCV